MLESKVVEMFSKAGIPVLAVEQTPNQYWPNVDAYKEIREANPWYTVSTPLGKIIIGARKRVFSIDWSDTPVRCLVTLDAVTKDTSSVHAWTEEDCLKYLNTLGKYFKPTNFAKALDDELIDTLALAAGFVKKDVDGIMRFRDYVYDFARRIADAAFEPIPIVFAYDVEKRQLVEKASPKHNGLPFTGDPVLLLDRTTNRWTTGFWIPRLTKGNEVQGFNWYMIETGQDVDCERFSYWLPMPKTFDGNDEGKLYGAL